MYRLVDFIEGQFNGINSIQFYSTIMFEAAGMENPKIGTVVVGIITIVITLVTTYLLTRFGRKFLLQVSLGMVILKKFLWNPSTLCPSGGGGSILEPRVA